MKKCSKCKLEKDYSKFAKKGKDKFQSLCKDCNKLYNKQHYQRNRLDYGIKKKCRKTEIKDWFNVFRNSLSCEQCGENHPATLDFHHKNEKEKDIEVTIAVNHGWSIERIKEEISKCNVLCSNCHRILHWEKRNFGSIV